MNKEELIKDRLKEHIPTPHEAHIKLMGPLHKPIKDQQDIDETRNLMSKLNYPVSMTDCEVVGIHGYCGKDCPVAKREECDDEEMNRLAQA